MGGSSSKAEEEVAEPTAEPKAEHEEPLSPRRAKKSKKRAEAAANNATDVVSPSHDEAHDDPYAAHHSFAAELTKEKVALRETFLKEEWAPTTLSEAELRFLTQLWECEDLRQGALEEKAQVPAAVHPM